MVNGQSTWIFSEHQVNKPETGSKQLQGWSWESRPAQLTGSTRAFLVTISECHVVGANVIRPSLMSTRIGISLLVSYLPVLIEQKQIT